MTAYHPNLLATDCAGEDTGPAPSARLDRAYAIVEALDATGEYDARVWAKGEHVRVYVKTTKGKDCGWLGVAADLSIDRSGLSKQAGTISSIATEVQS